MKRLNVSSRIVSVLASVALVTSMVPAAAFAAQPTEENHVKKYETPVAETPEAPAPYEDVPEATTGENTASNVVEIEGTDTDTPAIMTAAVNLNDAAGTAAMFTQQNGLTFQLAEATQTAALVNVATTAKGALVIPETVTVANTEYTVDTLKNVLGGGSPN